MRFCRQDGGSKGIKASNSEIVVIPMHQEHKAQDKGQTTENAMDGKGLRPNLNTATGEF